MERIVLTGCFVLNSLSFRWGNKEQQQHNGFQISDVLSRVVWPTPIKTDCWNPNFIKDGERKRAFLWRVLLQTLGYLWSHLVRGEDGASSVLPHLPPSWHWTSTSWSWGAWVLVTCPEWLKVAEQEWKGLYWEWTALSAMADQDSWVVLGGLASGHIGGSWLGTSWIRFNISSWCCAVTKVWCVCSLQHWWCCLCLGSCRGKPTGRSAFKESRKSPH